MRAIRLLNKEHQLIQKQIKNLLCAQRQLESGQWPPVKFFEMAVAFAQAYADRFHHFKEEFVLFGLLAKKKNGRLDMEIGALRHQHECCREATVEIERALNGYDAGEEISATAVLSNLASYTALLQRHIYLEDNVFFPMAEEILSSEDDLDLINYFAEEEIRMAGQYFGEKCKRQVEAMQEMLAD